MAGFFQIPVAFTNFFLMAVVNRAHRVFSKVGAELGCREDSLHELRTAAGPWWSGGPGRALTLPRGVAERPALPLQVLQHMKSVQADQERERQRRLEVERGRWPSLLESSPGSRSQQLVLLQELVSPEERGRAAGSGRAVGSVTFVWRTLSSPGFCAEPQSHVQLLVSLSAWRINRHLKLSTAKTRPFRPLTAFLPGNHYRCSHSNQRLESCP